MDEHGFARPQRGDGRILGAGTGTQIDIGGGIAADGRLRAARQQENAATGQDGDEQSPDQEWDPDEEARLIGLR